MTPPPRRTLTVLPAVLLAAAALMTGCTGADAPPPPKPTPTGAAAICQRTAGPAERSACVEALAAQLQKDTTSMTRADAPSHSAFLRAADHLAQDLAQLDGPSSFRLESTPATGDVENPGVAPLVSSWQVGQASVRLHACFAGRAVTVSEKPCH